MDGCLTDAKFNAKIAKNAKKSGLGSVLCGLGELCVKIPAQDPTVQKIQGSLAAKERKERKEQTL